MDRCGGPSSPSSGARTATGDDLRNGWSHSSYTTSMTACTQGYVSGTPSIRPIVPHSLRRDGEGFGLWGLPVGRLSPLDQVGSDGVRVLKVPNQSRTGKEGTGGEVKSVPVTWRVGGKDRSRRVGERMGSRVPITSRDDDLSSTDPRLPKDLYTCVWTGGRCSPARRTSQPLLGSVSRGRSGTGCCHRRSVG